jgi:hypothetical protein
VTDTIKRLAGPVQPAQTTAGTLLYTAGGSTVTAVKSALIHNTDPLMGAFFTMAIGSSLTDLSKRVLSSFYVAPGDTAYVPLDLVLGNNETLYARQSCMVDPGRLIIGAAVAAASSGSATFITTGAWTEAVGDIFLMTVVLRDTAAAAVISSFTDTHTGVTWTLLQGPVTNTAANTKMYQYTAQSTGTTNAVTTVTFDSTCDTSSISIVKITALTSYDDDVSGTNGSTGFRALGTTEAPAGTTPMIVAAEMGASVIYAIHHPTVTEAHGPMTGWSEVDDIATNGGSLATAFIMAPASWSRPSITTGTTAYQAFFAEILNSKRSLTVTLDGVEVT